MRRINQKPKNNEKIVSSKSQYHLSTNSNGAVMRFYPSSIVAGIIIGLTGGLIAQFIWKMIYFPEPIIPVILELVIIIAFATVGCELVLRQERGEI